MPLWSELAGNGLEIWKVRQYRHMEVPYDIPVIIMSNEIHEHSIKYIQCGDADVCSDRVLRL